MDRKGKITMTVKIYSKTYCPYCVKAKDWFKSNNVAFEEILLDKPTPEQKASFFRDAPGARTVPQIIVNDELIGGYEDGLLAKEQHVRDLLGI